MANLKFKNFVWPQDPDEYTERVRRTPVYEETAEGGIHFTGLSGVKRTITGAGVFQGPEAVENWKALETLAAKPSTGDLVHPVWGTRNCYFTELEMTSQPRPDVIHYRFTFTWADENNDIPM